MTYTRLLLNLMTWSITLLQSHLWLFWNLCCEAMVNNVIVVLVTRISLLRLLSTPTFQVKFTGELSKMFYLQMKNWKRRFLRLTGKDIAYYKNEFVRIFTSLLNIQCRYKYLSNFNSVVFSCVSLVFNWSIDMMLRSVIRNFITQ